jgi:hypothetical protein
MDTSILVVANHTANSRELLQAMQARAARGPSHFVLLVPSHPSRHAEDEQRMAGALERFVSAGLSVEGRLADPDPFDAVHEVWNPARFDEIIVCTLRPRDSEWLRSELPSRIRRVTGAQVSHVVALQDRTPHAPHARPALHARDPATPRRHDSWAERWLGSWVND